jgi:ATP-dependent DNA helicase RecG
MNLDEIKGIGPKTILMFKKLNIINYNDLITYYPYRYNQLQAVRLAECTINSGLVNGRVDGLPHLSYIKHNFNRLSFRLLVENKLINVTIFNRGFLKPNIIPGKEIAVIGKYDERKNNFIASDLKLNPIYSSQIEPVYHLVNGINNKQINKIILNALDTPFDIADYIPSIFNNKYKLITKKDAILEIHKPSSINKLKQAKLKLIYEEFFIFMFKMNYLKKIRMNNIGGLIRHVAYEQVTSFINALPFKLTIDQMSSVNDIYQDLISEKRMNRLILGDVGSGKTIVSIIAMYINYLSGYQSTLMAPTEVLALQHYSTITKLLPNVKVGLLVGSIKAKEKNELIKKLANNDIDILIGTHAILSDNVVFSNLGLVITDEQHRFGVKQRKTMQNKGKMTDVLYLSATPIPRTYALSLYGDMDLSLIKTKPNGRKEIITKVKKENEIKEVLDVAWEELKNNHQIYVVAPLINDDEDENLNDINKLKDNYQKAFGEKYKIAILHGKMKKEEKNKVMADFKDNKIQILISTTVIEVGIDVKNSTMMIIYNAERFGLATLHQLRGRVGRNDFQSYCFLICNSEVERLKVLEESNDGFYISERDFELRGEGDLFGIRQSGDMAFKIGDIRRDSKILLQCQKDSLDYLNHFDNNILYQNILQSLDINN